MRERPRLLYLLNSFANGGAEWGLVTLVEGGAFEGLDLRIAAIVRGAGAQLSRLEGLGHEVELLSRGESMRPADLVRAAASLQRLMRAWKPDALLLSLPQANILGRLAACLAPGATVLSFEHNSRLARPAYEVGFRATSPRVDWLLADSERTVREASRRLYWKRPSRISVLPLVSLDPPPPPRGSVWTAETPRPFHIVTAGRLTRVKNHQALVRALARVRENGSDARLTVYGEGGQRAALEGLVAELELGSVVSLPGHVSDWSRREEADLFVLPSRHEGLSIATVEAMHAGIPVAAADVAGVCDYAGPKDLWRLRDDRPETIAAAVEALIADPAARLGMSRAGQSVAQTRFSADAVGGALSTFNAELRQSLRGGRGQA